MSAERDKQRGGASLWWLGAMALVAVAAAALHAEALVLGAHPGLVVGDLQAYFAPFSTPWVDAVRALEAPPAWTDAIFTGVPYSANATTRSVYPLSLILALLPSTELARTLALSSILHLLIAAAGTLGLARHLGAGRAASLLATLSFTFGGWFLQQHTHLATFYPAVWLPAFWWVGLATWSRGCWRRGTVLGGLLVALQLTTAGFQLAVVTAFSTVLALAVLAPFQPTPPSRRQWVKMGAWLLVSLLLGFGIALVQVLPALELAGWSARGAALSPELASQGARTVPDFVLLVAPFARGPAHTFEGSGLFVELTGYIGLVPLVIVALRLLSRPKAAFYWTCLAASGLWLWLSLGPDTGAYDLLEALVPGPPIFRYAARLLLPAQLLLCLAAARAVDEIVAQPSGLVPARWAVILVAALLGALSVWLLTREAPTRAWLLPSIVAVSSTLLLVPRLQRHNALPWAMCCLAVVDLGGQWHDALQPEASVDSGLHQASAEVVALTSDRAPGQRLLTLPNARWGWGPLFDAGMVQGYANINGYDPLMPRRLVEYVRTIPGSGPDEGLHVLSISRPFDRRILRLGLRYLVVPGVIEPADLFVGTAPPHHLAGLARRHYVVELEHPQPPVALAPRVERVTSAPRALSILSADPDAFVVESVAALPTGCPQPGTAVIERWDPSLRRVRVEARCPTVLFVMSSYHRGWSATVDGQPTAVLPGNHAFLAVVVRAGEQTVVLTYEEPTRLLGASGSLVSLLLALLLWIGGRRRHATAR